MIKIFASRSASGDGGDGRIDPQSDVWRVPDVWASPTTHEGVIGLMNMPEFADIDIVFDATSAGAHVKNDAALREAKPDIRLIDLTPAAIGLLRAGG